MGRGVREGGIGEEGGKGGLSGGVGVSRGEREFGEGDTVEE